ncbi:trypsin-like peptidase domain-containing protein [Bradyrhizobium sp. URHD0069]|uniref:trypsin-like peptidase domain-containing protein n=1 Tax=Bradyrhizobium sp. URHD0069 TaxID=1380355 RepID=UPI0012DC0E7B|nr:trypsin-like peptidase domain-containing protein [Bradyrhizobium sp. URHD0069]
MPRINDAFLDCVVYLYPSEAAAEDGEKMGGTGFLVGRSAQAGNQVIATLFVVTNKHVIDNGSMVVRLNTQDGKKDVIPLDGAKWFTHPDGDDLAVCPIGLNVAHRFQFVELNQFLTHEIIKTFDIGCGDDVFIVGRFVSHEGKQKNLPTVRWGSVAQMPWEPIIQDDGFAQESFLVEARSISGFSGSPVFLEIPPQVIIPKLPKGMIPEQSKRPNMPFPLGPWLMGIDYCHMYAKEKVHSRITGKPVSDDWYVRLNTGIMGVVPAWKLADILGGPDLKPIMDEFAEQVARAKDRGAGQVALDSSDESAPLSNDANPKHRKDFTRLFGAAARKPPQER